MEGKHEHRQDESGIVASEYIVLPMSTAIRTPMGIPCTPTNTPTPIPMNTSMNIRMSIATPRMCTCMIMTTPASTEPIAMNIRPTRRRSTTIGIN